MNVICFVIVLFLSVISFCGCGSNSIPPRIHPETAWKYAEKSVTFRGRHSGSSVINRYADWIRDTARKNSRFKVSEQCFTTMTPAGRLAFRNIIAEIPGKSSDWVLVAAHYDAKKFLTIPDFQAANDGASGVAALLAMMNALQQHDSIPPVTVRFVFFDGEECLYEYSENDGLHGSREAARLWAQNGDLKKCRGMILLDMIGDKDLNLTIPANSSPELVSLMKDTAARTVPDLKYTEISSDMLDDHVPFQQKGVRVIDLIDFEYGPGNSNWHTSGDTLDQISASSIAAAADLTLAMIWRIRDL